MAKLRSVLLLLLVAFLALAFISSASAQNNNNNKNKNNKPQRPKPGFNPNRRPIQQQGNRPQKQQRPKPQTQQNKPNLNANANSKVFTTTLPTLGKIRGRTALTDWTGKSIMQFFDIPYGKAERFKAAEAIAPWKGILQAHKHHIGCPSIQNLVKFASLEENGVDIEDCLRLTVNTKSLEGNAPVMVYVHGDFFYDGDSVEAAPGYLLEHDVVLVSVRYRLGPFGFLSTLSEEMPGNAAVTDLILALKWIQEHIAAFGGDPERVTLFGQVGGAALINVLTLSPAVPKDLFHRVIYQSGTALSPAFITDSPLASTKEIARIAGCKSLTKTDSLHRCFNRMNATMLLAAFSVHGENKPSISAGAYGGIQLVIGGPSGILPEHPGRLLAAENFKAYPTLGGSVKHGGTFMMRDIFVENLNESTSNAKMTGAKYIDTIIEQINGDDPTGSWREFAEEYIFSEADIKNGSFKRLTPGLIDLCSTIALKNPVLLVLQANAKKLPNNTFLYTFDYEGELNRYATSDDEAVDVPFDMGVSLTDENLYLFPWPRVHMINANRDVKIAKRLVALWTSFAADGIPRAEGVPAWPSLSDETGPYMHIGRTVTFGENYLDEYSIAVQEVKQGYSLINDDYYELEAVLRDAFDRREKNPSKLNVEEEEEDDEQEDEEEEAADNEARGQNLVFIAKRRNYKPAKVLSVQQ
ncbi:LOW QUALITY PROTEIN: glutactin [Drosophila nasuta]|uniref:LOW QUALITY PROTEIN: glutactin n=1 Tax=Drosophila nasuta TaxID=42062 RepID=UPI00295EB1ED|nr:LOW QUALITY PROTEIN: glutactin [Drosophila nasuta]